MTVRDLQRYARDYDEAYDVEVHLVRARRRRALASLDGIVDAVVVEVGCGRESAVVDAPPVRSWHIVEPSPVFAAQARALATTHPTVHVYQHTLEEAAVALCGVAPDVVIVSALLHEVPDEERFLSALRLLCASHTRVHLDVPNALSLHRQLAVGMGLLASPYSPTTRGAALQQQRSYDAAMLTATLVRHGFTVEQVGSYFLKALSHAQLADGLRAGVITEAYLRACDDVPFTEPSMGAELYAIARLSEES